METIYILENKLNKKCYVGQTIQEFEDRLLAHKSEARLNRRKNLIGNAIRKYGIENFNITTMNCKEGYLDWMEVEWIKELNSLAPNGYNLDTGGNKNKHASDETREKISKSKLGNHVNKGIPKSEEHKKKLSEAHKGKITWMKGKQHTEEAIRKNSEAHKGIPLTEEHKKHISESHIGEKNFMYGKKHTEEALEKMRKPKIKSIR